MTQAHADPAPHDLHSLSYETHTKAHEPFLSRNNEIGPGHFNTNILQKSTLQGGPGFKEFIDLVEAEFRKHKKTIAMPLQIGDHFVVLALSSEGVIAIIDSLPECTKVLSVSEAQELVNALNQRKIENESKLPIIFRNVEEIFAAQQFSDHHGFVFALLNGYQIAKSGSIDGYQEVTGSISSGKLIEYEDIHSIGSQGPLTFAEYQDAEPYSQFIKNFSKKSHELLGLNIPLQVSVSNPTQPELPPDPGRAELDAEFEKAKTHVERLKASKRISETPPADETQSYFEQAVHELRLSKWTQRLRDLFLKDYNQLTPHQAEYILNVESQHPKFKFDPKNNPYLTEAGTLQALQELIAHEINRKGGLMERIHEKFNLEKNSVEKLNLERIHSRSPSSSNYRVNPKTKRGAHP